MRSATLTVSLENIPEVIWALRQQMAQMLREASEGEPEIVRRKLLAIASEFEVGVTDQGN